VGLSGDADGDPVRYAYQVRSTNGVVLYQTDWLYQNRLTIPEGLLQDGGNYAWSYAVWDGYYNSDWRIGGNFSVDLRTGKDKTSTYDDVGPVSVSLNNGNVFTDAASHSVSALGGSIGLNLSYNSPYASRAGLRAAYYNNQSWAGDPVLRRTEATIDNYWNTGSPAQGVVQTTAGTYTFGASNDDYVKIIVNNQTVYEHGGCYTGPCYGTGVTLAAGQTVPFRVDYVEASGPAYAKVFVASPLGTSIINTEWLRTAPMPTDSYMGLTGRHGCS
jgi:hypothetical protein